MTLEKTLAISEILETEQSYVNNLKEIIVVSFILYTN
jgi:hypothetical protein